MDSPPLNAMIASAARDCGFALCGVAPAEASRWQGRYDEFIRRGWRADMHYLARDCARRTDPRRLMSDARSVICLAMSYAPPAAATTSGLVARYARGRDYHRVLRGACRRLWQRVQSAVPDAAGKICVDVSPISERDLAARAGLGWIGRNGCLIHPRWGSYLVLAEIITDLPLSPGKPMESRCSDCKLCAAACPTGALSADGLVDCRRCNSYLTLEHRAAIAESSCRGLGEMILGCDRCQTACPFNQDVPAGAPELTGPSELATASLEQVLALTPERWDLATRGSAGRRATLDMLLRNAAIVAGNRRDAALRPLLRKLAGSDWPLAAPAARRALAQDI